MKTESIRRTRVLAAILAVCLLAAMVDPGSLGRVLTPLRERQQTIKALELSMDQQQQELLKIRAAELQARDWQQQALPADASQAAMRYQDWLVAQLRELGLDQATLTPGSPLVREDYQLVPVRLETEASRATFAELLDRLERAPALCRITQLQVAPLDRTGNDTGQLSIALQLEALSLIGPFQSFASEADPFLQAPRSTLPPSQLAERLQARNPFAMTARVELPRAEPDDLPASMDSADDEPADAELRFVATVFRRDSREAWLFDASNQEHQIVRERDEVELPQGAAQVLRISPQIIELVFAEQSIQIPLGGMLTLSEFTEDRTENVSTAAPK